MARRWRRCRSGTTMWWLCRTPRARWGCARALCSPIATWSDNIAQSLAAVQIAPGESLVAVLPFFHIYGMQVLMNCGLRAGATIVTLPRFDLEQFLGSCRITGSPGRSWPRPSWSRWLSTRWWTGLISAR